MELWDEVIQEFNEEIQKLRLSLGSGSADDYAHYRQIVGSIQGLEWARINLNDIVKKRIFSEEDEE
jgi:thymidylate synthase ThyX